MLARLGLLGLAVACSAAVLIVDDRSYLVDPAGVLTPPTPAEQEGWQDMLAAVGAQEAGAAGFPSPPVPWRAPTDGPAFVASVQAHADEVEGFWADGGVRARIERYASIADGELAECAETLVDPLFDGSSLRNLTHAVCQCYVRLLSSGRNAEAVGLMAAHVEVLARLRTDSRRLVTYGLAVRAQRGACGVVHALCSCLSAWEAGTLLHALKDDTALAPDTVFWREYSLALETYEREMVPQARLGGTPRDTANLYAQYLLAFLDHMKAGRRQEATSLRVLSSWVRLSPRNRTGRAFLGISVPHAPGVHEAAWLTDAARQRLAAALAERAGPATSRADH